MSSLADAAFVIATIVSIGWAAVVVLVWRAINSLNRLPSHKPSTTDLPFVSVVLPCRNERLEVARAIRTLLSQEDVRMQIVVVDDNSNDGTWELIEGLSKADERVVALRPKRLPPGWVAKNYMLELGQGRAEGDYLLFTDAHTVFGRRSVALSVEQMRTSTLDHIAVHPRLEAGSLVEAIVLPLHFILVELRQIDRHAAIPDSGIGAGVGAFNLVVAESYRLRGTHASIRSSIDDDRALGRMMRTDRGRGTIVRAVTQVRLRPFTSFREMYRGIRSEVLGCYDHRPVPVFLSGLALIAAALAPSLLLVTGLPFALAGHVPWVVAPALLGILLPAIAVLKARTLVRFEPLAVILFPLGALVIATAALHTALVFSFGGSIECRGRTYSRHDLHV